jgi:hypothetical protein
MDKHINFFELRNAAEKPGCPLCRIVAARAERYIDNMLFEHVSDRGFRARYRAAGGFCDFHSRGLEAFRDGLAVAILGRDILEDRVDSFKKRKPWRPKSPCPVCEERDRIEEEYLSFLAGTGEGGSLATEEETEFRAVFTASDGLCAPHYARLLLTPGGKTRSVPGWLKDFQETKFNELLARVGRFIEFSAYGRQEEFAALSEKDQLVWKELARSLRGSAD